MIDLQRYKKTYPSLRRAPRLVYTSDSESNLASATIETAVVNFGGADEVVYTFTKTFTAAPQVTLTPVGSSANFNVFVSSVSTSSVTVRASVASADSVNIHAIQVTS